MSPVVGTFLCRLILRCASREDRDWALAMCCEYEEVRRTGGGVDFLAGCLLAIAGRLLRHAEGRHALARHMVVLGMILPVAIFQFGCALSGILLMRNGTDAYHAGLAHQGLGQAARLYLESAPIMTLLLLILALAHAATGWLLLDRNWRGVAVTGTVTALVTVALVANIAAISAETSGMTLHGALLGVEIVVLAALYLWKRPGRQR
ncbi:hypothetical protein WJS89_09980 [Sphingomicrobium sp. XHP0235]|uniref:hypothetical protein n=1 Tax=Sphingomicrobium aquimarinum TaxID=3133971 RepID=UPI0031FF1BED